MRRLAIRGFTNSLFRPTTGSVLNLGSLGSTIQHKSFLNAGEISERGFATTGRKKSSSRSSSPKRARSASGSRKSEKSAKRAGSKRRVSSEVRAKRKAEEAEKKAAAKERKAEQRERRDEKEQEKKEARRIRKLEKRERKLARAEEDKERRAARRADLRERRAEKKEEEKLKARARREKEKARAKGRRRPPGSPPMPRNPMSLYVKSKLGAAPGATQPEKLKHCVGMWKKLSAEEKKPFEEAAAADKDRYAKEFAAWRKDNPAEPKRPITSFALYMQEHSKALRESNPALKGKEGIGQVAKILGQQWQNLNDTDKAKYVNAAEKNQEAYHKAKEAWTRKMAPAM
jgi:hypothetical protein